MAQCTLRISGEGVKVVEFEEGQDTLKDLVQKDGGVYRASGNGVIQNPDTFLATQGMIVDWTPAPKAA